MRKDKDQIKKALKELLRLISEQPEIVEQLLKTLNKASIEVYTSKQAAELLQCHEITIRRAIKSGKLKASKIGRDYRISKPDLTRFYKEQGGGELFADSSRDEQ
ncbi:MAG: helix-turn-helix domain-containing protein [Desulfoferrobacter sp.]